MWKGHGSSTRPPVMKHSTKSDMLHEISSEQKFSPNISVLISLEQWHVHFSMQVWSQWFMWATTQYAYHSINGYSIHESVNSFSVDRRGTLPINWKMKVTLHQLICVCNCKSITLPNMGRRVSRQATKSKWIFVFVIIDATLWWRSLVNSYVLLVPSYIWTFRLVFNDCLTRIKVSFERSSDFKSTILQLVHSWP